MRTCPFGSIGATVIIPVLYLRTFDQTKGVATYTTDSVGSSVVTLVAYQRISGFIVKTMAFRPHDKIIILGMHKQVKYPVQPVINRLGYLSPLGIIWACLGH